ncbi:TatD family hydrolase [Adlercreutzia murintestinalis]|uniref:TatD family hydrolase n=1 Tax=Adlercreutzia murintestinalis TaxID=2941325 RepID=UPI00203E4D63|nr:TatD family hydrolase [Adlercreutzia murintestinalis]
MTRLYDMHCHLDFADNAAEVAAAAHEADLVALCSTVVPSSFVAAREEFSPYPNIHVALGVHPWWVAQERVSEVDLARFEALAAATPFIGEVGLDFHSKRNATRQRQEEVLYRLLSCLDQVGPGKLIFLHAVHAADAVLDMLERCNTTAAHTCVFHWFQGTPDDFGRALAHDCWFSVGMRMLATDAGRLFAKAVPDDRLLVETDNPPHEGMPYTLDMWTEELRNTVEDLAELRETNTETLSALLASNSAKLLDRA